jgi:hypothetical protein
LSFNIFDQWATAIAVSQEKKSVDAVPNSVFWQSTDTNLQAVLKTAMVNIFSIMGKTCNQGRKKDINYLCGWSPGGQAFEVLKLFQKLQTTFLLFRQK